MNEEKIFKAMADIDEKYLIEAKNQKKSKKYILPVSIAAAIMILFIGGMFISLNIYNENSYQVKAAEIGKGKIQFGATMPTFVYYDNEKVIMYDYIGIWVYNFKKERLSGFCDFRPIDMTQIQGSTCVLVEATTDGEYVRFYKSDDSKKYLYDVTKDSYKKVDSYDSYEWGNTLTDVTRKHSISDYSLTYQVSENEYLSYILDISSKPDDEPARYNDLVILKEVNGKIFKYVPFAKE